jgi:hypothetical protein
MFVVCIDPCTCLRPCLTFCSLVYLVRIGLFELELVGTIPSEIGLAENLGKIISLHRYSWKEFLRVCIFKYVVFYDVFFRVTVLTRNAFLML